MKSKILIGFSVFVLIVSIISLVYSCYAYNRSKEGLELACSNVCDDYLIKYNSCFCGDIQPLNVDGRVYYEIGGSRDIVVSG